MTEGAVMKSGGRFCKTLLAFTVIGSIMGGLVPYLLTIVAFVIPAMISLHGLDNLPLILSAAAGPFLGGAIYAIILEIVPAVAAGLALGAYEYVWGRSAIWLAAIIGMIAGVVWVVVYLKLGLSPLEARDFNSPETLLIVVGSIFASVFCWWLMRPRTRVSQ